MMAVVQSLGGELVDLYPGWAPSTSYGYGSMQLYDRFYYDYATLYRTQPNVRTCVDFLARNIAQLGLHVFRRVSETDRQRLRDHPLAQTLNRPLPPQYKVTRYKLISSLVSDLGIYFNAYWLKLRAGGAFGLLRIPPQYMVVTGGLVPTLYQVTVGGRVMDLAPDQVVHYAGYNPENPVFGLSPLETLRRILAEEAAMGDYREYFWANSARMNGIIQRPADAPEWSADARTRFKTEFEVLYAGGPNSGKTAILEEGMTWKEASFNAQESEYLGGRKLTREECARAYHIPLPMVGILDHATFSNITEQHKDLYQDCLGPWLAMIEEEIALQLLPEFEQARDVYVEFNIAEKLQGSFDEQTKSMQSAVGRPWMTANEARARFNLPSLGGDADALVTPLNVLVGGQASPRDSAPSQGAGKRVSGIGYSVFGEAGEKALVDPTLMETRERHVEKWLEVLRRYFGRQHAALVGRVREGAGIETVWIDGDRWDRELGEDLFRLCMATATVWANHVADALEIEVDTDRMTPYVSGYAERTAQNINLSTREQVAAALSAVAVLDALKDLFDRLGSSSAGEIASSTMNAMANLGSVEGAKQGGLRTKTWVHHGSKDPRDSHVGMSGQTVGIGERFSNGMKWPGDPAGGAGNNAHCHCSVTFGRDEEQE